MKALILGADGFIGRNTRKLLAKEFDVWAGSRTPNASEQDRYVDLLAPETISSVLEELRPDVVINCAGIVENGDNARQNLLFTTNLLAAVVASKLILERIIISGSSAEYGLVDPSHIPVREDTPLNPSTMYGTSKVAETNHALFMRKKHDLPIVIARIFNPIGRGMHRKFLIPSLLRQIQAIRTGEADTIEVSRLDSRRDYIDVRDVALAIKALITQPPGQSVYNIGSGESTSNGELIEMLLKATNTIDKPRFIENSSQPEALVAIQADISRIKDELGWAPIHSLDQTIKGIINDKDK